MDEVTEWIKNEDEKDQNEERDPFNDLIGNNRLLNDQSEIEMVIKDKALPAKLYEVKSEMEIISMSSFKHQQSNMNQNREPQATQRIEMKNLENLQIDRSVIQIKKDEMNDTQYKQGGLKSERSVMTQQPQAKSNDFFKKQQHFAIDLDESEPEFQLK